MPLFNFNDIDSGTNDECPCDEGQNDTVEVYRINDEIVDSKRYAVSVFMKHLVGVTSNTPLTMGGTHAILRGSVLRKALALSKTFADVEEEEALKALVARGGLAGARPLCMKAHCGSLEEIQVQFERFFYAHRPYARTLPAFQALCRRARGNRYKQRQQFTYLVVKNAQCSSCLNSCIISALKKFYRHDSKCEAEVDACVRRAYSDARSE